MPAALDDPAAAEDADVRLRHRRQAGAMTIVVRPSHSVRSAFWIDCSDSESSAEVASSKRMIGASFRNARAMAMR